MANLTVQLLAEVLSYDVQNALGALRPAGAARPSVVTVDVADLAASVNATSSATANYVRSHLDELSAALGGRTVRYLAQDRRLARDQYLANPRAGRTPARVEVTLEAPQS